MPVKLLAILIPTWLVCAFPPASKPAAAAVVLYGLACSFVYPLMIIEKPMLRAMFGLVGGGLSSPAVPARRGEEIGCGGIMSGVCVCVCVCVCV